MKVVGLITEYNPFHNGHKYHIEQAKKLTGADYVVVVMSGNFVQRGTPAILDKYTRCEMALRCGADLVFELPVTYATASAEYFALGAVKILDSLGFVDAICFGSECGDISLLSSIADIILEEPHEYKASINEYLKQGLSYPIARSQALNIYFKEHQTGRSDYEEILTALASPNNILGIEYIKALRLLGSTMVPQTITRICSSYHEQSITGRISSASSIRAFIAGDGLLADVAETMPSPAYDLFALAMSHAGPITQDDFSSLLSYKLLYMTKEELLSYLDVNEDIAARILKFSGTFTTYSDLAEALRTKNITHTRMNRILCHILLEIKKECFPENKVAYPVYLRLLGMKKTASFLIKSSTIEPKEPLITKLADARAKLSDEAHSHLALEIKASTLYNQKLFEKYGITKKDEYRQGIVIV